MLKRGSGTPEQAEITAFLGKGTEFNGVLSFAGTIRVDGKVEGEIISKDTLIAGDGAYLLGDITVGTLISSGRIEGNVTAHQKAHFLAPSNVQGSIKTPKLIIEEGVIFDGTCEMSPEKKVVVQNTVEQNTVVPNAVEQNVVEQNTAEQNIAGQSAGMQQYGVEPPVAALAEQQTSPVPQETARIS